ncbi:MAG: orotidine-5'-phosphate decarboxylase [Bacillota bacterium]
MIIALDVDTVYQVERLVNLFGNQVGMFKIGLQLIHNLGPSVIDLVHQRGGKVFADFKFHDIPNTVAQASRAITRKGVAMFNLHASGGREMLQAGAQAAAMEAAKLGIPSPMVLAVTVLTSWNQTAFSQETGIAKPISQVVKDWSQLAQEAGLHGVVASPWEIRAVRESCGEDFLVVTPGVRPLGASQDDQQRVMTPTEAVQAGASYLVIGRPVTAAPDPAAALESILATL